MYVKCVKDLDHLNFVVGKLYEVVLWGPEDKCIVFNELDEAVDAPRSWFELYKPTLEHYADSQGNYVRVGNLVVLGLSGYQHNPYSVELVIGRVTEIYNTRVLVDCGNREYLAEFHTTMLLPEDLFPK